MGSICGKNSHRENSPSGAPASRSEEVVSKEPPGTMEPQKVTVTLQFQYRKSKVEIDSAIKKTDLYEMAKKQLCFKEDCIDLSEYLYDKESKKWKGVCKELTLEEGMKLKWKKHIPDGDDSDKDVDSGGKDGQTELMCLSPLFTTIKDESSLLESGCYGANLPKSTLWKGEGGRMKTELTVYFFEHKDRVLEHVYYDFEVLTPRVVMEIVNKYWTIKGEDGKYVPKFKHVTERKADIRVQFRDRGMSWSKLGSDAQTVQQDKPTLVLKLNAMDYYNIRATIVHEFGHALGLGHEHQHPEYWRNIKKFLSLSNMKADLKLEDKVFDYQWANNNPDQDTLISEYDEDSVMHYHTKLLWLKDPKYRERDKLKHLKQINDITEDEYKALKGFHKHINFISDSPSDKDKKKLAEAYRTLSTQLQHVT